MFYVFEGMNGTGKSTIASEFAATLPNSVRTHEPGGSSIGRDIRSITLGRGDLTPEALLFLMMADREMNMQEVVLPALRAGKSVISDRGYMSSMVFQANSELFTIEQIKDLNQPLMREATPVWFLITANLDVMASRLGERSDLDHFEKAQSLKVREYQKRYIEAAELLGAHIISNNGTVVETVQKVQKIVANL